MYFNKQKEPEREVKRRENLLETDWIFRLALDRREIYRELILRYLSIA